MIVEAGSVVVKDVEDYVVVGGVLAKVIKRLKGGEKHDGLMEKLLDGLLRKLGF